MFHQEIKVDVYEKYHTFYECHCGFIELIKTTDQVDLGGRPYEPLVCMECVPRPQPSDFAAWYLRHQENGFFVDVGAYDGITYSNSLVFSEGYGWKGICIEPHPVSFKALTMARTHPATELLQIGLGANEKDLTFVSFEKPLDVLSGFKELMSDEHIARIESARARTLKLKLLEQPVQVRRLENVLSERNIHHIDYLSIDVEGGELEVLDGIDFEKTTIDLISCEANSFDAIMELEKYFKPKGYKRLTKVCGDVFYAPVP